MPAVAELYLADLERQFRRLKETCDLAVDQLEPELLTRSLDAETNSIAVNLKHLAGNLRSRWQDFLITDGEKPDRHRDGEFELTEADTVEAVLERWEAVWEIVFSTIRSLTAADLERPVAVRCEKMPALEAINRQLTHCAYHAGQIVLLAKHLAGASWTPLSIPRGESEKFNAEMRRKFG
jgi:hypothetical protein